MGIKNINIWYISSLLISIAVAIPILTICVGFFENTSGYYSILKNTALIDYINHSLILLFGVLTLTFIIGVGSAYFVSFYYFPQEHMQHKCIRSHYTLETKTDEDASASSSRTVGYEIQNLSNTCAFK